MGTRHYQCVFNKHGIAKIRQYGQWDGYPSGQGVGILNFLLNADLEKYQEELEKIHEITPEESKMVENDPNWKINYPHLSRDCGSDIHQMVQDGKVNFVQFCEQKEAENWCSGFYTINFQTNEFISEFYGKKSYPLDNLPTIEQYLADINPEEED